MKVKLGDKIRHSVFGGKILTGIIEELQVCHHGEKSGHSVKSVDTSMHHGVVDLDNGHWCYFDQIIEVLN